MGEISKDGRNYIGYDYKELTVDSGLVSAYLDRYENFGWIVEQHQPEQHQPGKPGSGKTVIRLIALVIGVIGTAFMAGSVCLPGGGAEKDGADDTAD